MRLKITSAGIVNGIIEDRFGKRGEHFLEGKMPTWSLPLKIEDAPEGTKSFALILEDKDAIPVCGFSWIHWTVANLTRRELAENESQTAEDFVQGTNSWSGKLYALDRYDTSAYGGMSPPDQPHVYELHVFALDKMLEVETGFYMNELYKKMQGHILASETLTGIYNA
jgi:hypothetical protein